MNFTNKKQNKNKAKSIDWPKYRKLFPVTDNYIYLNNGSVAPVSLKVNEVIQKWACEASEHGYVFGEQWCEEIEKTRTLASELVQAQNTEIAFIKNTSHGISQIAQGLNWEKGDEIILLKDDFPSNVFAWENLQAQGVIIKYIEAKGVEIGLDQIVAQTSKKTKLLALSSCHYLSGFRPDLAEIGNYCRERHILFFVDAIQSLGAFEIDVVSDKIDFLAADAHKWLCGPEGIGILYVRQELIEKISPLTLGWNSVENARDFNPHQFKLKSNASRFEEGSPPTLLILALQAALKLILEIGVSNISQRLLELRTRLINKLQENSKIKIYSEMPVQNQSSIVSIDTPNNLALFEKLSQNKIIISLRKNKIRFSAHFYNSEAGIDRTGTFML